ncbi:serine/threonine-protein kinase [Cronbergia sp. UHCC 0137]|uniref:serine/threonine-protein kinase n=1 Tax=Cronbergia sp. UHCC 0137 TaxID=3110239 RepID=UPI002B1F08DA|nr:serine/threonine-protein kinase [Cronbergia sp. UHCC 0137]MEA5617486.1 serine/threonine-protein kinase [Cronbergia sp. UHCC 0137]
MQVYCNQQHANSGSNRFCIQCGEPLPLPVGEMIDDRYQIVRMLGQGGFGRSYLAIDTQKSRQECVLKEFAPLVQKPQQLQKAKELFEREASVLKKLQHPQIPRFQASLQTKIGSQDFFFLVQDYIDGDNYETLLAQRQGVGKSFSEEEIVNLLVKILPVLSYIHSQKVIHRDISPDNLILRRADNLPMLIDFGGVKQHPMLTGLVVNGTLIGKNGYAPDEQLRLGKAFNSSDLYSLAVTVLVLLTGKKISTIYDSFNDRWLWGKEIKVSAKLEAILKKMLAHQPSDRYQQADIVLKDLGSLIPGQVPNSTQGVMKTQNPYITTLNTMVVAPGRKHVQAIVSRFHSKTQVAGQKVSIPEWLRLCLLTSVGTGVVVLTIVSFFTLGHYVVRSASSFRLPSFPQLPEFKNPLSQPGNSKKTTGDRQRVFQRLEQLEISSGFVIGVVDEIFHQRKPQLKGRSLTKNPEDAALRAEWDNIANDVLKRLEKANLSLTSRRKLGKYTSEDYEGWRRQAQAGVLGKYKSIDELKTDTYKKFDPLFPGQERGKLNQQTFLQIWYAIASDQIGEDN